MSRNETLEDLMERPLYEHVRVVPPLLKSAAGGDVASEYERRVNSSDWGGYPDIGFLNTIRYAKQYLESDLEADESVAHYLGLITMDDWKKNRSHPELSDSAFDGPMSENAYPEERTVEIDGKQVSMNEIARRYNKAHGMVDKAAGIPWTATDAKARADLENLEPDQPEQTTVQLSGLNIEQLMLATPLQVLQIMPAMLGRKKDVEEGVRAVEDFYDQAQEGDYKHLYRLTVRNAAKYLGEELEVTRDEDYYLDLVR